MATDQKIPPKKNAQNRFLAMINAKQSMAASDNASKKKKKKKQDTAKSKADKSAAMQRRMKSKS